MAIESVLECRSVPLDCIPAPPFSCGHMCMIEESTTCAVRYDRSFLLHGIPSSSFVPAGDTGKLPAVTSLQQGKASTGAFPPQVQTVLYRTCAIFLGSAADAEGEHVHQHRQYCPFEPTAKSVSKSV